MDFRNTIIIMTSNVGAKALTQEARLGFKTETKQEEHQLEAMHETMKSTINVELKKVFKPEFLNRIDHIVVFRALSRIDINQIIKLQLAELTTRLAEKNISLKFTTNIKKLLVEKGYDAEQGARPLKRAIQSLIEDKLASAILDGTIKPGDVVKVSARKQEVNLKALAAKE